ncbi:MAG: hypothetical protein AAF086_05790 [Planctomycetota bacterium]
MFVFVLVRFRGAKQRLADRLQFLLHAILILVRRLGHPPRHAIDADAE